MEQVLEIISSRDFIFFAVGIGISGLIGWYISSHFSTPRIRESKLKQLKKIKQTDFGQNREYMQAEEDEFLEDPFFGQFIIQPNGVMIDTKNELMWIRAPWGMNWNGREFVGEPVRLDWYEASHYFGKGAAAGHNPTGTISEKDLTTSNLMDHYQRGKASVLFANYDDWRMPTAYELNSLSFVVKEEEGYRSFSSDKAVALRERLFPNLKNLSQNLLWSANLAHSGCAWAVDGNWPPGDVKLDTKYFVLFVRSSKG